MCVYRFDGLGIRNRDCVWSESNYRAVAFVDMDLSEVEVSGSDVEEAPEVGY